MKIFKSFKLLTKTTLFYLVFVFIAFFVSAHYFIYKANTYVLDETEHIFKRRQHHITHFLNETDSVKSFRTTFISEFTDGDTSRFPEYRDTIMYIEELGENQLHRQKSILVQAKNKAYLVTMVVNIDDFTKLKKDIINRFIPSFIILALIIILFNAFMSGYLLKPFHKILEKMNLYKVGRGVNISDVNTTTLEFKKMQHLFSQMIKRTENDYQKLKEYTENMAHEIQTPLTIIRNKTEKLISDEGVMTNHKDTVKAIYDETNHLSKLGTTLNLLTKIDNGEYTNTKLIETKSVILKHVEAISELVDLKSLQIETELDANHKLLIDPFLLDIIMKNLLRNAVRYATNKGPIKITTKNSSIIISNFGDELKVNSNKIFERFYTTDNSNQSLGLGLSLVKRICDLNQLNITYQNKKGQHVFIIDPVI